MRILALRTTLLPSQAVLSSILSVSSVSTSSLAVNAEGFQGMPVHPVGLSDIEDHPRLMTIHASLPTLKDFGGCPFILLAYRTKLFCKLA